MMRISDKWVVAGVHRGIRRGLFSKPDRLPETLKKLGDSAVVQIFDARCVVSVRQIHAAAVAAHLAFKAGTNISKKFEIEFLLRLAADTQINRVLDKIGVKPDTVEVGFCAVSDDKSSVLKASRNIVHLIGGEPMTDEELKSEERLKKAIEFYGITEKEIESVQAGSRADAVLLLILERIATLDLKR